MDNTKLLSPNGSLCVSVSGKVYEPNKTSPTKKSMVINQQLNGKSYATGNGSLFTVCTSSSPTKKVAKVLMTPPTIMSPAPLQFHTSMHNSVTALSNNMRNLAGMSTNAIYLQESGKFPSDKILSTMITATSDATKNHHHQHHHMTNTNASHKQQKPIDMISNTCDQVEETTDGNGLVNAVKSVLGYLIKPILETKTRIIGDSRAHMEPQTLTTRMSTSFEHHPSNHTTNGGCSLVHILSTDMENVPFFDCDDYIEGSEDTVDFVADSTKIPWDTIDNMSATSESIYFECNPHFKDALNETAPLQAPPSPQKEPETIETVDAVIMPKIEAIVPLNKSNTASSNETMANANRQQPVQYVENKLATMLDTKDPTSTSNARNNAQRKRRRRQQAKGSSKRSDLCHKALTTTKNRNEKLRHNLEMDINDDLYVMSADENVEDDNADADADKAYDGDADAMTSDVEVIDVDESSNVVESIVPEVMPSGRMFTHFYCLANPLQGVHSIPAHLLARLTAIPTKSSQHQRSCSMAHLSETESEDSFVTFSDNCNSDILNMVPRNAQRRRQASESSDDFIVFFDDTIDDAIDGNGSYNDDTFGDDYTDSSDDSDADAEDTEEEENSDSGE